MCKCKSIFNGLAKFGWIHKKGKKRKSYHPTDSPYCYSRYPPRYPVPLARQQYPVAALGISPLAPPPPVSVGCQKLSHDVVAHWRLPESWIDARSSPRARGPRGVGGPEQQRHGRPIGRRAVEELELTDFHEREGHLGSHHPVVPDADVAVIDFPYRSVSTVSAVTRHGHARSRMRSQERRSWMGGGDEKKKGLMANCWIIRIYEEGRLAKQITKW